MRNGDSLLFRFWYPVPCVQLIGGDAGCGGKMQQHNCVGGVSDCGVMIGGHSDCSTRQVEWRLFRLWWQHAWVTLIDDGSGGSHMIHW